MHRSELILLSLSVVFLILGLIPIPASSLLLVLSLSLLACYYYLFGFVLFPNIRIKNIFKKDAYRETNAWQVIGSVFTGFFLGAGVIGVMFKLQIWAGANIMLVLSTVALGLISLIAVIKYSMTKRPFYRRVIIRTGVAIAVFISILYTPAMTYFSIKHRRNQPYVEAMRIHLQNPTPESWKEVQKKRFTDENGNPIEVNIEN